MKKLLLILFFLPLIAGATDIYIATTGNDNTGNGSSGSPYATIQKGVDVASPGDNIIVKDGAYSKSSGTFIDLGSGDGGTAGNYVTIKSEHKYGAVLDGQDNGTTGCDYCFMTGGDVSYIKILDFEIKNFVTDVMQMAGGTDHPNAYITVQGNHIHHIGNIERSTQYGGIGSYLADANHITFTQNIFNDLGYYKEGGSNATQQGIYLDGCSNISIYYNIFYNFKGGWAIQIYSGSNKPTSDVNIYNNTFAYSLDATPGHIIIAATASGVNIKNNIFYSQYQKAIRLYDATLTDLVITNNIIGATGILYGEDFVTWVNDLVQANNRINTDPLMTNPANGDFSLQSNSPAINAGVDIGLTTDYTNATITDGEPDMGCYEYFAETPPGDAIIRYKNNGKWVKTTPKKFVIQ